MLLSITSAMKVHAAVLFLLLAGITLVRGRGDELTVHEGGGNVEISPKCAAVLLSAGTVAGAGAGFVAIPAALGTVGFGAGGIAGGSFASWWQSMIPMVTKGSLFAMLQSIAMGGVGAGATTTTVAVGAVLGMKGALYLRNFCTFVDETDPESVTGIAFQKSVQVAIASKTAFDSARALSEKVQNDCSSSETCATIVDGASKFSEASLNVVSALSTAAAVSVSSFWTAFKEELNKKQKKQQGNRN